MKFPVIVFDGGPFVCESMSDVSREFEANDFYFGKEYISAFDSEGNLLQLDTEWVEAEVEVEKRILWFRLGETETRRVSVEIAVVRDNNPPIEQAAELRRLLIHYLSAPRIDVTQDWLADASLDELIAKATKEF